MNTPLRAAVIRLAAVSPNLRAHLLGMLREATDFPTQESLSKYLKEHPGADKSKHTVVKSEGAGKPSKDNTSKGEGKNPFHAPDVSKRTKATLDHAEKAGKTLGRLADQAERLSSYRHSDPEKAKKVEAKAVELFGDVLDNGVALLDDMKAAIAKGSAEHSAEQSKLVTFYKEEAGELEKVLEKATKSYHAKSDVADLAKEGQGMASMFKRLESFANLT